MAGDLNTLQSLLPSISDFMQTIDVGTLRVGNSSLQLIQFSSTEARITGAFRSDGIIRSGGSNAGGLLPGTYTTTQRNSIGSGFKPFGMAIVNITTGQWEWNSGTDGSPVWKPLGFDPSGSISFTGATSAISWTAETATTTILSSTRSGESAPRWIMRDDGYSQYGAGSVSPDTGAWYRNSSGVIRTPSSVIIDGAITIASQTIADYIQQYGVPAGSVFAYGGSTLPSYYVWADGSTYDGTDPLYARLWNALGTTHGGTGIASFKVPDGRGRGIIFKGTNSDVSSLGASDGIAVGSRTYKHYHGLGTIAIGSSGSHGHTFTGSSGTTGGQSADHTHDNPAGTSPNPGVAGILGMTDHSLFESIPTGGSSNNHTHSFTPSGTISSGDTHIHANGSFTGLIGATSGIADAPAWIVLNAIVKL